MKQKIIELDDCTVTVKELTVRDVKNIVTNMKDLLGSDEVQMQEILTNRLDDLVGLAGNIISLSNDKDFLDLSFSDIETIFPALLEVNASFFGQMAALGILPSPQPLEPEAEVTE